MKKKINISILQFIMLTLALTGCQLQKQEITSQDKVEPVEIMHIGKDNYNYDIERFTKQFMGMSLNDAEKYDIRNLNGSYQFQKNGLELIFSPIDEKEKYHTTVVTFYNHNENVGPAYETLIYQEETVDSFVKYYQASLRDYFPKENLENYSKEDAISFCKPYAEALGYGNSEVTVFAMREQELQDISTGRHAGKQILYGAPDPGCKLVYRESELEERKPVAWEKKDEAFLLLYRPLKGGYKIDWGEQEYHMVYVPARNEIVYANGELPFVLETSGQENIISSETALSKVMQANGISNKENIEVISTEMVYSSDLKQFYESGLLHPYWKINFKTKRSRQDSVLTKSTLINAITGQLSTYDY
jgi:hypothetical protein